MHSTKTPQTQRLCRMTSFASFLNTASPAVLLARGSSYSRLLHMRFLAHWFMPVSSSLTAARPPPAFTGFSPCKLSGWAACKSFSGHRKLFAKYRIFCNAHSASKELYYAYALYPPIPRLDKLQVRQCPRSRRARQGAIRRRQARGHALADWCKESTDRPHHRGHCRELCHRRIHTRQGIDQEKRGAPRSQRPSPCTELHRRHRKLHGPAHARTPVQLVQGNHRPQRQLVA